MTCHTMPAVEKTIYTRGALPWSLLVHQCGVDKWNENQALKLKQASVLERKAMLMQKVHDERKSEMLFQIGQGINTARKLNKQMDMKETQTQTYLRQLVAEGKASRVFQNNRGVAFYSARKPT